jgi:DNA primase
MLDSLVDSLNDLDEMAEEMSDDDMEAMLEEDDEFDSLIVPLPLLAQPAYYYHSALGYLLKRGLTLQQVFDYEIHYCKRGKFGGRIIFPVRDLVGNLVGYTSRGIFKWSSQPKYKTPSSFSISSCLYGGDLIKEDCENLIIVEGPFDKINVGENCVATFGKQMSKTQLRAILDLTPKSISLVYDADAKDSIISTAALLSHYVPVKVVMLPEGEDPASLPRRKVISLIQQAPYYRSIDWSVTMMGIGNDAG